MSFIIHWDYRRAHDTYLICVTLIKGSDFDSQVILDYVSILTYDNKTGWFALSLSSLRWFIAIMNYILVLILILWGLIILVKEYDIIYRFSTLLSINTILNLVRIDINIDVQFEILNNLSTSIIVQVSPSDFPNRQYLRNWQNCIICYNITALPNHMIDVFTFSVQIIFILTLLYIMSNKVITLLCLVHFLKWHLNLCPWIAK